MRRKWILCAAVLLAARPAHPHGVGTNGAAVLDWRTPEIARVVSPSTSWNNLGVTSIGEAGEVVTVGAGRCLRGGQLDLDVANGFAFDLDETVRLRLQVLGPGGGPLLIAYDKSDGFGLQTVKLPNLGGARRHVVTVELPHARFADRGDYATDLMIVGQRGPMTVDAPPQPVTICNVRVERSYRTAAPSPSGTLDLSVVGESGAPMPVRIGLYDESGRMPVPGEEAVAIEKFDDRTRTYLLRPDTMWPADDKFVFYIDGRYHAQLPAGRWRVVASRGIEYRLIDQAITIEAGKTLAKTIRLERWADQPAAGWYSGDVHIHYARRDAAATRSIQLHAQAEDLHVANLLQMGNVAATHFEQQGWGREGGRVIESIYALVSGQEDPRTAHRGHTIHLNLKAPVRFPDQYLLYHRVFEAVAAQGGLSGYAHVGVPFAASLGTPAGLALEGPFDLLDFVEIAQGGGIGTELWFDLLDLGLRIAPAAGTDYPYLDHPGAVRNYVHVPGAYSVDGWFAGLEAGHTFVTTGPLLEVSLNGAGMGDKVRVAAGDTLAIIARASLNPDLDRLDRLEILEQGRVVASAPAPPAGGDSIRLEHRVTAARSTWFVVRASGKRARPLGSTVAVSAPVYVIVDGDQRTWNREAVPGIVERFVGALDGLQRATLESSPEQEGWETGPVWQREWQAQLAALGERIEAARSRLRALAAQAAKR